jgi:serine/threonine protein kinase
VVFEAEREEVLFLSARRGRQCAEYLCYTSGRTLERDDLTGEHRALLARVLGVAVTEAATANWAARSQAEQQTTESGPVTGEEAAQARNLGGFDLLSVLGQGGMGKVYRAWQPSLGRMVALKCLLRAGDARAEARFAREIRALGRVEHPHLVKIFTSGSEGEQWFYAMELVEGVPLSAVCDRLQAHGSQAAVVDLRTWHESLSTACEESRKEEQPLGPSEALGRAPAPAREPAERGAATAGARLAAALAGRGYLGGAAELVRQVAEAAHALHEGGVVHRDIKPGNIIVSPDGSQAVLMDLGLAQIADEADGRLTRTRQFVGTLRYASPEQVLASARLDRRSDVYSLGVTLWELLTLRPMYGATDQTPTFEVEKRITFGEPERVRPYNPTVPADLEAVVMKCLEKDSARRYPTARELADDLGRYLAGEPVKARPLGPVRRGLRWVRRRPAVVAAAAALLLAAAVAAAAYRYWDAHARVKVTYTANNIRRWGVLEEVGQPSADQVRHRAASYKFYRRGGLLETVEVVNAAGQPVGQHGFAGLVQGKPDATQVRRACRYEYRRDDKGALTEVVASDRVGEVVWVLHYTGPGTAHYTDRRGYARPVGGTGAAYVQMTYDADGWPLETRFFDVQGRPQPDGEGRFGLRDTCDWPRHILESTILGADGQPAAGKDGFLTERTTFDAAGNIAETAYLGLDGRPALHKNGYVRIVNTYDAYGNVTRSSYLGTDGKPALHRDGYAGFTLAYDGGNPTEETFLDGGGQPAACRFGYARIAFGWDGQGNCTGMKFYDALGQPCLHSYGHAALVTTWDEHGNRTSDAYFDPDGRPTPCKDGFARVTRTYDDHGRMTEARYLDADGRPALHKDGNAGMTRKYDDGDNLVEQAYFDEQDRPARIKDGSARWSARYDDHGNRVEAAYWDENGHLIRAKAGYAKLTAKYDERGNRTEEAYFDDKDDPTRNAQGFARRVTKYDDRGNVIDSLYYDADNKRTADVNGVARWQAEYDARGNRIREASFGIDGKPVRSKLSGYASFTAEYDERGNQVAVAYLDENDKPLRLAEGYARMTSRYDARGDRIEVRYLDPGGKLVRCTDGVAQVVIRYDERGNRVEESYLDENGQPVRHKYSGARCRMRYDARGNQTEIAFYDLDNKLVRNNNGYARRESKYDPRGNCVEEAYFDEHDKPGLVDPGYARWTAGYDARGNKVEVTYFSTDGSLARLNEGWSHALFRYDNVGNLIERTATGLDGSQGFTKTVAKFGANGKVVELAYFAGDRPAVSRVTGYARRTAVYDDQGNWIDTTCFDVDGRPVPTRVVIKDVERGGPGARLGLKAGDVLLTYDHRDVVNVPRFMSARRSEPADSPPKELGVLREGKELPLQVPHGRLGIDLEDRVVPN